MNAEFTANIARTFVRAFAPMLLLALAIAGARLWRTLARKNKG